MDRPCSAHAFELRLLFGYVGIVLALYVLVVPGDITGRLAVLHTANANKYFILPMIGLPFVFSFVTAVYGGRRLGSLLLGIAPGAVFMGLTGVARRLGTSANGDASVWGLAAVFSGYGLLLSAAGYLLGRLLVLVWT